MFFFDIKILDYIVEKMYRFGYVFDMVYNVDKVFFFVKKIKEIFDIMDLN